MGGGSCVGFGDGLGGYVGGALLTFVETNIHPSINITAQLCRGSIFVCTQAF